MAWTAPRTFVAGELETASLFNTHLRDNLNALHDFLTGAQDLASNWLISSGRTLSLGDAVNVAHGMTTIAPTSTYAALQKIDSAKGGLRLMGLSDSASGYGLILEGMVGNATPTVPGLALFGAKQNGTGIQDFAASERVFQFVNNSTEVGSWYGAGLNVVGGLAVGYAGVPSSGFVLVGDGNFGLNYASSTDVRLYFDSNDFVFYDRSLNQFGFYVGSARMLTISATTVSINTILQTTDPLVGLGGGAAPTFGTIGGSGPLTAAQNKWFRMRDSGGADFWVPVWK